MHAQRLFPPFSHPPHQYLLHLRTLQLLHNTIHPRPQHNLLLHRLTARLHGPIRLRNHAPLPRRGSSSALGWVSLILLNLGLYLLHLGDWVGLRLDLLPLRVCGELGADGVEEGVEGGGEGGFEELWGEL